MSKDEFCWNGSAVTTPDGYEAELAAVGGPGMGGVLVVVRPPWAKPFSRVFMRSPSVDREAERLIRAHRAAAGVAKQSTGQGSDKLH